MARLPTMGIARDSTTADLAADIRLEDCMDLKDSLAGYRYGAGAR